jgi:diguanylate cyclase (GGDEF)-like protein/putative nucleotidyltransferase with HDIG domain
MRDYRALCEDGQRLEREGRFSDARHTYEHAINGEERYPEVASTSTVLRWIARSYQAEARFDEALDCLEAAYACADADGDEQAYGHAQNLHAIIWWQQGNLDEARRLYLEARERALRNGDTFLAAMTAQNLGVIASVRGETDQALLYYDSSLREYRQLGRHRDECIALNNLGLLQTQLKRWPEAQASYAEALALAEHHRCADIETQLVVNHAALTVARGDFAAAESEVALALNRARAREEMAAVAEALKLAGIVARNRGSADVAEVHFRDAAQIAESRHNILLLAELARESALLYRSLGRNRDLLRSLNTAHRLFSQLKARHDLADIERHARDLESEFIDVARKWGESTESKDRYTQGHCERVADVACALATHAGLDADALFWFRIGTLLHDVGKLVIPEEVLNKPGRLSADEWELVKRHPLAGVQLLSDIEFPWDITPIVRSHHESWDGSGYPEGLAGEDIPLVARMVCLADVYDALTSERSYKKPLPHEQAMQLMRRDIGRQFDPHLFRLFEEVMTLRTRGPAPAASESTPAPADAPTDQAYPRDELTGLLLRRGFIERASIRIQEADEKGVAMTLVVIDVDAFKSVNDTFGHLQGDDVLREVGAAILDGTRDIDLAGRYAGDEFVLLLEADTDEAVRIAERLRATVGALRIPLRGSEESFVSVSLSMGLGILSQHGRAFDALFAAADRALYDAKHRGRNCVAVAGTDAAAGKPRLDLERFVGRGVEVSRLVAHFDAVVRGQPRVVAIIGEAGVGKTRLVRRIQSEVRLRTGIMVVGRSQEPDIRPPYGPWMDVIAGLHGMGLMPAHRWPELERLVPQLHTDGSIDEGAPASKYALLEEIVAFLRSAAAQRPLVIVLDDMQWGDSASWDAVEHVVSQLERERILICLTIRREDADRVERSRRRLSRNEHYHQLQMGRLLPAEVRSWVGGALQQPDVDAGLPDAIFRYTEGNPLFVKQVLQALFDEGLLWHGPSGWAWRDLDRLALPTAIDDLLKRRLTRLSPRASRALAMAAVFGRTFDIDDLGLAVDVADDELLDAIDEGVAAGVIEPAVPGDDGMYTFAHVLLVESLKKGINRRRLQGMHLRVAETVERRRPNAHAEIATLFELGGDDARAYHHAILAGESAVAVHALEDAIRAFHVAARHASTREASVDARMRLLRVKKLAGQYDEAEALCDDLIRDASEAGMSSLALTAACSRLEVRALRGEPLARTLAAARTLLDEARAAGALREVVGLLTMISDLHAQRAEWSEAKDLAREAWTVAATLPEPELHGQTAIRLGSALLDTSPAEALEHFRSAAVIYESSGSRHGQTRCLVNCGIAWSRLGDASAAELAYREAAAMAESARLVDLGGLVALNLALLLTRAGRYEAADEQYEMAMQSFKRVKNEPRRLATIYAQGHHAREQGDPAKAYDLSLAAAELAQELGVQGLHDAALGGAGLAAMALGKWTEVEVVASRLKSSAPRISMAWFPGREIVEAFLVRYTMATGDRERATAMFLGAASAVQGDPYASAWLAAECATLVRGGGERVVRDVLHRAMLQARRHGFEPIVRRLTAAMRVTSPTEPVPSLEQA